MILSATAQSIINKQAKLKSGKMSLRKFPHCAKAGWLCAHQAYNNTNAVADILTIKDECVRIAGIELLESTGCDVTHTFASDTTNPVSIKDHFLEGFADAIILSGLIEAPKKMHIVTVNTDDECSKILLMLLKKCYPDTFRFCDRILSISLTNDGFNTKRIHYDGQEAERLYSTLVTYFMQETPSSHFLNGVDCASCPYSDFCSSGMTNVINCHSCAFFNIKEDGSYFCSFGNKDLALADSWNEYDCHSFHPALVPFKNIAENNVAGALCYQDINTGKIVYNGLYAVKSKNLINMFKLVDAVKGEVQYGA